MGGHTCKVIILLLCVVSTAICSKCNYIETFTYIPNEHYISGTCYNVSSDLSLDLGHENATLTEMLTISYDSRIPIIPAKSQLTSFSLLRHLTLTRLDIEKVTPGAFDGLENLEDLYLSNNRLSEVSPGTFNKLQKLETLNLDGNILMSISAGTFNGLKLLKVLDLSQNLINHIDDDSFIDLVALERLDLANNNLTHLQEGLFKNLKNLSSVGIGNNPLRRIDNVGFRVGVNWIDISYTDLKDINFGTPQQMISILVISRGRIEEIDFDKFSGRIEYMSLSENRITTIKNFNSANIQTLNLDLNNITELEVIPQNVIDLSLQGNQIKNVTPVSDPTKYVMNSLNLDNNEITVASCFGLASLQSLYLKNNNIIVIKTNSFVGCTNLTSLYLSANKIESIEVGAFSGCPLLDTVSLSENNLKTLNYESFLGLNQLSTLYFDHNQITSFDVDGFLKTCPELKYITIDNPFPCKDLNDIFVKLKWYYISVGDITYINYEKCGVYNNN